jgi:hypothetical protein
MAQSLAGSSRLNAYVSVAASQTDSAVVTAVTNRKIRVVAAVVNQGDTTPSTVTFNSTPAGAGAAVFPALKAPANGTVVLPDLTRSGWFETTKGEGLSVTTGAGSTTSIAVVYELIG